MSTSLSRYRIRLAMNPHSHDPIQCIIQARTPLIWRGVDVDVEIGIFTGTTFVDTITNITSVTLEIHPYANRSGAAYVQKTVLNAAMNGALTSVLWTGGLTADCHAKFVLADTDTNFDFTDATDNMLQFWMVIHATLTTGEYITLGSTILQVEEDAAQLGVPVIGSSHPAFRVTSGEDLQLLNNDTGKWHTIYIVGAAGAERIVTGPGET